MEHIENGECKKCGYSKENHIQGKSGCDVNAKNGGFETDKIPNKMLSKHLQLVEREFDSRFMNNGVNGVLDDKFQDEKMLLVKDFLLSQIRTAVENERKELLDSLDNIRKFSVSIPNYETQQKVVKLDDIKDYLK